MKVPALLRLLAPLLFTASLQSQTLQKIILVEAARPEILREISLPRPIHPLSENEEITINTRDQFFNHFGKEHRDLIHEIDWQKEHIVGMPYCDSCLQYGDTIVRNCPVHKGNPHRYWYVASDHPVTELEHRHLFPKTTDCDFRLEGRSMIDSDSLYNEIVLVKFSGGDYLARFVHKVVLDSANRKLIWKELNVYGGSRAAGHRMHALAAPKPPEGFEVEIIEILISRRLGD